MSAEQAKQFEASPFMAKARQQEDYTSTLTGERDKTRKKTDKDFHPTDDDWTASKAFDYDKGVSYYIVLGVDEYATLEEVKKAYKKLSLLYHPDKTAGLSKEEKEEKAAIFIELKNAYLVLGDQATRRQYDKDRDFVTAGTEVNGYMKRKERAPFDATEVMKKIQEHYKPPGKEIDVEVLCKLEKFFYGGAKQLTRNRVVIQDFQESLQPKHFRLDVPKGADEPWECKTKGGDMHHDTQADTLRFIVASKPHKVLERRNSDLIVKKEVLLRPDAHLQPFLNTEVNTVAGRTILLWGQNPLYSQAASAAVLNVSIAGEALDEGRLRFQAKVSRPSGDETAVVTVRTTYTKITFFVGVSTVATLQELSLAVQDVLELPADDSLVKLTRDSSEPFESNEELLGNDRSVLLDGKVLSLCEVPMSLRRARELLGAVAAFAGAESFGLALGKCEKSAGSMEHGRLLRELWEPACPSALLCGYEPSLEGLRAAVQRALWLLREEPDAGVLQRRFAELGFVAKQPQTAKMPRRRKLPRPDVESFLIRNLLGPEKWGAEEQWPDPGSESEPEDETERSRVQKEAEEESRDFENFLRHGGSGSAHSSDRWNRRLGVAFGAAAHPLMQKRASRRALLTPHCNLELEPLYGNGESLQLFTKPSCFLHFYSNIRHLKTRCSEPGLLEPTPVFAVAICCPTGAKRQGCEEWRRLRHELLPMLKQGIFMLLAPARALLPQPLLAAPAFSADVSYRVSGDVKVARLDEKDIEEEKQSVDEAAADLTQESEGEEENNAEIIRLAKKRVEEARGAPCDFEDLEDLDELEEAAEAVRSELREQRLRRRAAREVWQRETRMQCQQKSGRVEAFSTAAVSADHKADPPELWKRLAVEAFKRGDYYLAQLYYSKEAACHGQFAQEEQQDEPTPSTGSSNHLLSVSLSNRSLCLVRLHHLEAALEDAKKAASLRPDWGRAWGRVGAASTPGSPEAREAWRKAVELDPTAQHTQGLEESCRKGGVGQGARSLKELGIEAFRSREWGKAIALFTEALAAVPPPPERKEGDSSVLRDDHGLMRCILFSNRSAAFAWAKIFEAAALDAERAVAEGQTYPKAYCRLGLALLGCGKHEQAYVAFAEALRSDPKNQSSIKGRQACLAMVPRWTSQAAFSRRWRFLRDAERPLGTSKVFTLPELHFDRGSNEAWAHGIHATKFLDDILIVPGNIGSSFRAIERALTTLRTKFRRVFYLPGNHEMWLQNIEIQKFPDSLCKLWTILELCDKLGIDVAPAAISRGVYVVPLFSWYNAEFDVADPYPDPQLEHDRYAKWPMDAQHQVWRFMLAMNRAALEKPYHGTVITFSHFVPRSELPVSKEYALQKAAGCAELDEQLREARSTCHVYGHSSKKFGKVIDEVAYINAPHSGGGLEEPLTCVFNGKELCSEIIGVH
eukprot:CAMPEP_0197644736 /NCGR_PEP_ID=MMETSP1338-20131121/17613_1 /TAXON_ID=43686 ORGANISM="Pelagodinium beii, Strain RCC1491" /NCGR_SAMPLE_ID=MMETSP1338 /ASSEMBLY_ACC=CAM_ASM_000754 /LENGTH=1422 /DNA_ID=CAMNT_0043218181 /DNA_START=45 /DNA_END=4313 /DNA_ORIENTATION=+